MSARVTEVARDGLVLDVRDEGPTDGVPVVLLHGFPERSTAWRHVAPLLHAAGLRTLAMDQRGYAPRARPPRRRDYALAHLVDDAAALVAQVHERTARAPHLVGHDWGAVVSWSLASRRPAPVASLTALSVPHPAAMLRAGLRSRQALRSAYMAALALPVLPERAARRAGGPLDRLLARAGMGADDLARFRREVVEDGALPGALGWYRALAVPAWLPAAGDGAGAGAGDGKARRVRVPTTVVWSDGDSAIDRWGAEHCGELVDAAYELVVLRGVTHWIPTQAPRACADAVLARVRAAEEAR